LKIAESLTRAPPPTGLGAVSPSPAAVLDAGVNVFGMAPFTLLSVPPSTSGCVPSCTRPSRAPFLEQDAKGKLGAVPGMLKDRLSLTFDDGPDEIGTPGVVGALRRSEARATFFMVGERAQAAPSLVRSVLAAGHEVQLHCHRHVRHTELSEAVIELDTDAALEALGTLGVRPTHWRTPWGVQTPATASVARSRGLKLVGWTLDTHDWRGDASSSIGAFTELLAPRCERLVAIDFSARALELARGRVGGTVNVELAQAGFPEEIPAGAWDLIVCSEVLYYLDGVALRQAIGWLEEQLASGASLVAVSWRGTGSEEPLHGDEVHDLLAVRLARWHAFDGRHPGYRLDRFDGDAR
jgi:peptidoglycan/xylan/chitin deacetylase (PgdA/CDA1 family)